MGLAHRLSRGLSPTVVYEPHETQKRHGNFLSQSYRALLENENWRRRMIKEHTKTAHFPGNGHEWCDLDSCTSSDALLMNIFCNPLVLAEQRVRLLFGVEGDASPEFGFRPRVPLAKGYGDNTEVDMHWGNFLVEAKLTEYDFTTQRRELVLRYRDLEEAFDVETLPQNQTEFYSYQLIRNVLAASALNMNFCVMFDQRRPDLLENWYQVMSCVRSVELRLRCKTLTWQEFSEVLPDEIRGFLRDKYGIGVGEYVPAPIETGNLAD